MATRVRSYSKINLGLAIGPLRPDGFHDLLTLYQTLALHDLVTVSARPSEAGKGIRIRLTTDHPRVPIDSRNTAWQMVERALKATEVAAEVEIHIEKRLPVQGGMGAGSANAAAALLALERETSGWDEPVQQLDEAQRLRLAAEIGSDVPLFLIGGAVLGSGRGELVTAMPEVNLGHGRGVSCVVAVPAVGVSTPFAFRQWDARQASQTAELTSEAIPSSLKKLSLAYISALALSAGGVWKSDTSGIVGGHSPNGPLQQDGRGTRNDLAENTLLALVRTGIENDFEQVVFPYHPSLCEIKRLLMGEDSGQPALVAALSGSGSALFGLYRSEDDARAAQQRVQSSGTEAILTETLSRTEFWKQMFADVG